MIQCSNIQLIRNNFTLEVDFSVAEGKLLSLLGTSGAGKSSVLHCIAGFEHPQHGDILLNGKSILHKTPQERKTHIVFQDYALFPHFNVYENIAYGLKIGKYSAQHIQARTNELIELFHIAQYKTQSVEKISGGEQQRVALARAIASYPEVLLLDEPLGALDVALRAKFRKEIRTIQTNQNLTCIYVTHDQEEAFAISDFIAIMSDGKIAQIANTHDLYYYPKNSFVANFLGECSLLSSTVLEANAQQLVLNTPIGKIVHYIPPTQAYKKYNFSQILTVCIRPERVYITNDISKTNTFHAQIIEKEFRGGYTLYTLVIEKEKIYMTCPSHIHVSHNELYVEIDPHVSILEE